MENGNLPSARSNPELAGHRTINDLLLEMAPHLASRDPRSWESASLLLDEMAAVARTTSARLRREALDPLPSRPGAAAQDLEEALAKLKPGPHQVLQVYSTMDARFIGALLLEGRRREERAGE